MSCHFPSTLRLQSPDEFKKIWRIGRRFSMPLLAVIFAENTFGYPRLGVSIAKKNVSSAVARNRIKRLARETFRVRQHQLGTKDLVIVGYKGIDQLQPKEQYESFNALWDSLIARQQSSSSCTDPKKRVSDKIVKEAACLSP